MICMLLNFLPAVEQAVCLVHDEVADLGEGEGVAGVEVVRQPTRGGDHDVRLFLELSTLKDHE